MILMRSDVLQKEIRPAGSRAGLRYSRPVEAPGGSGSPAGESWLLAAIAAAVHFPVKGLRKTGGLSRTRVEIFGVGVAVAENTTPLTAGAAPSMVGSGCRRRSADSRLITQRASSGRMKAARQRKPGRRSRYSVIQM